MRLYLSQQVYQLDRLSIEEDKQPSQQLMKAAAACVWKNIQMRWPGIRHVVVLAGSGNNGGDAFAVASMMKRAGLNVSLITMGVLSKQSVEAQFFRRQWESEGGEYSSWSGEVPPCDLIVDGLQGIGLSKSLDDNWQTAIETINQQPGLKVAIDIPSGLNANTGTAMPVAIQADLTVSFIGRKIGCYLSDGPDYCGERVFDDLGLSRNSRDKVEDFYRVLDMNGLMLPGLRRHNSYKNQFGHVLVVGGDRGMSGAVRLAAKAALRSGSGLVSVCVHPDNYAVVASQQAELMVSDWNDLPNRLDQATVVVVGPGLGQSKEAKKLLKELSKAEISMVIDADALDASFISGLSTTSAVLTPHPGEAARLLKSTTQMVQQDRLGALQKLNQNWPFVSVLKGSGTLVGEKNQSIALCSNGHAGMATAGMGDVLAGLIGGYLGQGLNPQQAAETAVLIHALAAEDYVLTNDENSLIASDVIDRTALVMRKIRKFRIDS